MMTSRFPSPPDYDGTSQHEAFTKFQFLFKKNGRPAKQHELITDVLSLPNSSVKIPQLGFGVYLSTSDKCKASCLTALKAGYRHIDSAQ
jgi:hypothetical protein